MRRPAKWRAPPRSTNGRCPSSGAPSRAATSSTSPVVLFSCFYLNAVPPECKPIFLDFYGRRVRVPRGAERAPAAADRQHVGLPEPPARARLRQPVLPHQVPNPGRFVQQPSQPALGFVLHCLQTPPVARLRERLQSAHRYVCQRSQP